MLDTTHPTNLKARSAAFLASHPWRTLARLLPFGIALMVMIDLGLGDRAEYFNAHGLIEAWAHVIAGGPAQAAPEFIMNQAGMGIAVALVVGTTLLIVEPAVVLGAVVLPASYLARRRFGPTTRSERRPRDMHIHTEIEIHARPDDVWDALVDVDSYPTWNPYHVHVDVDGELAAGKRLVVEIHKPNGDQVTIRPHVLRLERGRELTWGGGPRRIFRGEHTFIVEPTATGTRLIHSEVFSGFAVRFASLDSIEEGYTAMNLALKRHLEIAHRTGPQAEDRSLLAGHRQ